jgi:hypothetical protein
MSGLVISPKLPTLDQSRSTEPRESRGRSGAVYNPDQASDIVRHNKPTPEEPGKGLSRPIQRNDDRKYEDRVIGSIPKHPQISSSSFNGKHT